MGNDTRLPEDVVSTVRRQLATQLDPGLTNPFSTDPQRPALIRGAIATALTDLTGHADAADIEQLYDDLIGLGPLQPLMADSATTDILVNRHDEIFVERHGRLERTDVRFRDQAHLEQVIQKIVALVGREVSVDKPLVDARMVDGSRANAVYAPVGGPTLCIRKFNALHLRLAPSPGRQDWVSVGGMSLAMARFLEAMALARATVLVAGATGAGKSTLLRSLVDAVPAEERIITIEDTAELELDNPHWVKLECVHHHELGGHDSSARRLDVADLVQNALRMRPDRLIVGEVRNSREAYHTLEALNTGHDGSATTIHASSGPDALARLELLIGRSFGHLQPADIRGYIARVIDVIAFVSRMRSGHRCVLELWELAGTTADGAYDLRPVFTAEVDSADPDAVPQFSAAPAWSPGPRLARKLALEGLQWAS